MPGGGSVEPVPGRGHGRLAQADPPVVARDARVHEDTELALFEPERQANDRYAVWASALISLAIAG